MQTCVFFKLQMLSIQEWKQGFTISEVSITALNNILLWDLSQTYVKKGWLKELLQHLKGFIKTLLYMLSSADRAAQLSLRSVTQSPFADLSGGLRNADTHSGKFPTQIIQNKFSGKLSSFLVRN